MGKYLKYVDNAWIYKREKSRQLTSPSLDLAKVQICRTQKCLVRIQKDGLTALGMECLPKLH